MRLILIWAAALAVGALAWGTEPASVPAKKATSPKKSVAPAKRAPAHKTPTSTASAHRAGKKAPTPSTTWRNRQAAPSPERYKEIQAALVAKGYLQPQSVGVWDQTSMDALKRFQTEQNLDPTGKINSLSLIALGLGPKYDSPARVLEVNPGQYDR